MQWWLISDETAKEVIRALKIGRATAGGVLTAATFSDALHSLESGMHQTDAVPADWARPDAEGGAG